MEDHIIIKPKIFDNYGEIRLKDERALGDEEPLIFSFYTQKHINKDSLSRITQHLIKLKLVLLTKTDGIYFTISA